jgi:crotonobetainyl-CoA:carnitine CoA-transferase CaiB-like acyl-CoA transferase
LCDVIGAAAWTDDDAYATAEPRLANADALDQEISAWTAGIAKDDVAAQLQARGVPAVPMLTGTDMGTHPHYLAHEFAITIDQQELGPMVLDGAAFHGDLMVGPDVRPAPAIGEHTRRLATTLLGLTDAEVDALLASGALETTPPVAHAPGESPG